MSLWQDFCGHNGKMMSKWVWYLPIYEKHFEKYRNSNITFLEIGVAQGGSMQMWRRYFGPSVKIIGIDINPDCKRHQTPGTFIRIGDQSDSGFLQSIIDEFGVPDIILDDGSHQQHHVQKTFDFFYPLMPKNGIYMVEDLACSYWEEYNGGLGKETFLDFTKTCVDKINARHSRGIHEPDHISNQTSCISIYDSLVCFERGELWWNPVLDPPRVKW
jgi:23S rRNA U2552 (ribose-2'-O)-methylase RlmE/FtsJ